MTDLSRLGRTTSFALLCLCSLVFPRLAVAQEPASGSSPGPTGQPPGLATRQASEQPEPSQKIRWPNDRKRVICNVGGANYTVEDMLGHIAERHAPAALRLMDATKGRELSSPRGPTWVRQYADVLSLERFASERGIRREQAEDTIAAARKKSFENWLESYAELQKRRGRRIEADQQLIDQLYAEFKRTDGLAAEVTGWLEFLVPEVDPEDPTVRDFYDDHPQYFGGVLTIAHILIETRDERTLELKTGDEADAAERKIAAVKRALELGEVEFDELARRYSDDANTARLAGRIQSVKRFDSRLPASVCRAAWELLPDQIAGPVRSPYGIHFIKNVGYRQLYYVFFTDEIKREVAQTLRKVRQEELLFGARREFGTTLHY